MDSLLTKAAFLLNKTQDSVTSKLEQEGGTIKLCGGVLLSDDTVFPSKNFTQRKSQWWSTLHPLFDV
jgi:hypothetical protein